MTKPLHVKKGPPPRIPFCLVMVEGRFLKDGSLNHLGIVNMVKRTFLKEGSLHHSGISNMVNGRFLKEGTWLKEHSLRKVL